MKTVYLMTLGLIAGIVSGCNEFADLTNSQSEAVTVATNATCDRYDACGKIGAGKAYENRESCENHVRDFWNRQWTAAQCEGHIDGDALDVCTDRISSTDCNSFVDQLNTVYNSCDSDDVCR